MNNEKTLIELNAERIRSYLEEKNPYTAVEVRFDTDLRLTRFVLVPNLGRARQRDIPFAILESEITDHQIEILMGVNWRNV